MKAHAWHAAGIIQQHDCVLRFNIMGPYDYAHASQINTMKALASQAVHELGLRKAFCSMHHLSQVEMTFYTSMVCTSCVHMLTPQEQISEIPVSHSLTSLSAACTLCIALSLAELLVAC